MATDSDWLRPARTESIDLVVDILAMLKLCQLKECQEDRVIYLLSSLLGGKVIVRWVSVDVCVLKVGCCWKKVSYGPELGELSNCANLCWR